MIAIVTIDDNSGMMFNKRRQSKDIRLIERILDIAGTNRIWVSEYSSQLFDTSKDNIIVDNSYTEAQAQDYCFVENCSLKQYEDKITKIILIRWGRSYPADTYFDINLTNGRWKLLTSTEFEGNSHKNITREEWVNE